MRRALVVDDQDENRSLLASLLRGRGWEVVEARHGAEALEAARRAPFDVVISDLLMPVMDGYALARQWKTDAQLRHVPFIVYTATYMDPRDEQLALDMGVDEFIAKPVEPARFVARLEEVLARVLREGAAAPRRPLADADTVFYKYSSALVRKLEQKQQELQTLLEQARASEAALRTSEARVSAILRASPAAIALIGSDGSRLVDANDRFCELVGIPREAALGAALLVRDLFTDPALGRTLIETTRRQGWVREALVELRRPTGELRDVLVSMTRVDLPGESDQILVATFVDTTDARQTARRIQHLNRVYAVLSRINETIVREGDPQRLLTQACEIAVTQGRFLMAWIGLVDPSGRLRIAAHAGAPADTLAIVEGFVRGDGDHPACAFTQHALSTGEPGICNDIEHDPRAAAWRDEALAWGYRAMASLPLEAGDRVIGLFNLYAGEAGFFDADEQQLLRQLAADIAFALEAHRRKVDRQRAEAALRASEERFRLLIEYASDIIAVVDARGLVRYISPAVERVLGYRPEELVGQNAFDFLHRDDAQATAAALARAMTDPAAVAHVEHRLRHRDGSWRILESTGRSVPNLDSSGFIVVNARDVTEAKRLEEQFRRAQKLEAVGQLAGGIAHDFNNVLTAIMMQAELADAVDGVPAEARELLRDVKASAERAASLTRQLLAFSRRQVLQPQTLDLNEVVAGTVRMLQRILGEDIELRLDLCPRPVRVHADAGLLEQVLMNLVVNARDAMPQGGWLAIATGERVVGPEAAAAAGGLPPGRYVHLRVSDSGCGIAPEHLPHIFEPFFTTKQPGRGTGLGLATVFGIVTQHGGTIQVASEVGRGTTFDIDLLASEAPEAPPFEEGAEPPPPRGTETILLVEDDVRVRMLTRLVLERHGYDVLEAGTGIEALTVWRDHGHRVDLLLTDVVMPGGLTGRDLATQLHASKPDLAVVFTSGYSAEAPGRGLMLHEGEHLVPKPSPPRRLLETLRRALDARRQR